MVPFSSSCWKHKEIFLKYSLWEPAWTLGGKTHKSRERGSPLWLEAPGDLNLRVVHAEPQVIDQLQCRFSYLPVGSSTLSLRCFCSSKVRFLFCPAGFQGSSSPRDLGFTGPGRAVHFSFCSAFYLSRWSGNSQVLYMPFWELEAFYPLWTIVWDILLQILKFKISLFRLRPPNIVSLKLMWYLNKSVCQWFVKPSWDYSIEGVDKVTK